MRWLRLPEARRLSRQEFAWSGAVGPWLVATADEVGDPARLILDTRLSGEEVQRTGLDRKFFGLQRSLRYISAITPLLPGHIIATGSPEGSGAQPQPTRWLEPSDQGWVEIKRVGLLGNPIA